MEEIEPCEICRLVPKAELHAHITGSYSTQTLRKLAKLTQSDVGNLDWMENLGLSGFDNVFKYFGLAQKVTCTQEAIYIGTRDIIDEFLQDNVRYLELRTTPKNDGSMTPSEHIASVVKAISESKSSDIVVKLLLSIDRRRSLEDANVALRLAHEFRQHVVGIDLSGDPHVNDARNFLPVLSEAQRTGFKLALHMAEIDSHIEETTGILGALRPDRIGHGTFLSNELAEKVIESQIPLELCITSNMYSLTCKSVDSHHMNYWHSINQPVAICTDDKGAFRTSGSQEMHLAHQQLFRGERDQKGRQGVVSLVKSALTSKFLSKDLASPSEWACIGNMESQLNDLLQ